ncbi:MAG: HD domain-containing protein [Candidatus Omnitrophica bacterium]|nr:HD domain-containing protein [Candidatus Omnitrophota bacterium]
MDFMADKDWQKIEDWMVKKLKKGTENLPLNPDPAALQRHDLELDYQVILEEASRNMIRFKSPEHLIKMIIRTIDEQVKTYHTAMLVFSEKKNFFMLVDSKGAAGAKIPIGFIRLNYDNPMIRLFSERINFKITGSGAINKKELTQRFKGDPELSGNKSLTSLIPLVIKQMDLLRAEVSVPVYYKKKMLGILLLGGKVSGNDFSRQEISFFTTLANDVAMALTNAQLIQNLSERVDEIHKLYEREHRMFLHTAISLAAAIDARDPYTHGHTERVTRYAQAVAIELEELPEARDYLNFKETVHVASLLHDVGKIGVPDSILNKPTALTKDEYEKVKEHAVTGATILSPIRELGQIANEIRSHHERYDGTGYPDNLAGDQIPFISRIIAVADTFDAMTSDRPYRQGQMKEIAVKTIFDESGKQFDPIVVSAFLLAYRKGRVS